MDKRLQITVDVLAIAIKLAPEIAEGIRTALVALKSKNNISDEEWEAQKSVREALEAELRDELPSDNI